MELLNKHVEQARLLPDDECHKYLDMIIDYTIYGENPDFEELTSYMQALWIGAKNDIDNMRSV